MCIYIICIYTLEDCPPLGDLNTVFNSSALSLMRRSIFWPDMFATHFGVYAIPGPRFAQMLTSWFLFGTSLDDFWDHFGDLGVLWDHIMQKLAPWGESRRQWVDKWVQHWSQKWNRILTFFWGFCFLLTAQLLNGSESGFSSFLEWKCKKKTAFVRHALCV